MADLSGFNGTETRVIYALATRGTNSYQKVADACDMTVRQLYNYRQRDDIQAAVREVAIEQVKEEIPPVLSILRKKCMDGNMRAIELYAKLSGLIVERQEVTQKTDRPNEYDQLSPDELQRQLDDLKRGKLHLIKKNGTDN